MKTWLCGMCVVSLVISILLSACNNISERPQVVVVYTSVDQPFSEPILKAFQEQSGINVQAIYDVEAAKTSGLVNRLLAEKDRPKADVFWNSEIIQTIRLQEADVLQPYISSEARDIPEVFRHPAGYWSGNAVRARVILVNTDLVEDVEEIDSMEDLIDPRWSGEMIGIAYPLFGTTATHAAALYAELGREDARAYFEELVDHGVQVVDGNSVVRDMVANGSLAFGFTDTDDACGALIKGAPVAIIFPDQNDLGTLVIPSTVALIHGAPNPDQGKALIDFLLSTETEQDLIDSDFSHIPLHADIRVSSSCISDLEIHAMDVDFNRVFRYFDVAQTELKEVFLR